MEKENIKNIDDYFPEKKEDDSDPQKKWEELFNSWIDKIDSENKMLYLFELKLWFESIEEFFSSQYFSEHTKKFRDTNVKDYGYLVFLFYKSVGKIIQLLKDLDFKKDKYLINFEEYIVGKLLEEYSVKLLDNIRKIYSPESFFYNLRFFLQNMKDLSYELLKLDEVSQKAFNALKKIYHKELMTSNFFIDLLKKPFIPKMDRIYQKDITNIIANIEDKELKKFTGIFFIFAFKILKINNFIEININKSKYIDQVIPLLLTLKKYMEKIINSKEKIVNALINNEIIKEKEKKKVEEYFVNFSLEYKKIFDGELPIFFDKEKSKINKRDILKNVVMISEISIQELIENIAKVFNNEINGKIIFENYISRKEKSLEVKKKLIKLHTRINDYFSEKSKLTPSDIFYDISLFIESDLNYLLYKDWNEFLSYYNNLLKSNFSSDFNPLLRSFHSFITNILKDIVKESK